MVTFSLAGRRGWNKMDMLRENPLHLTLRMEVEPIPIRERLQDPLISTGQLNWPVAVFGTLGAALIVCGLVVISKKKKNEKA